MKLEKRVKALEARLLADSVLLHFADGSTRLIMGRRYFLLDLFARESVDLSPTEAAQLDLIRRCVAAEEPGGARLVELMQSVMGPPDQLEDGMRE